MMYHVGRFGAKTEVSDCAEEFVDFISYWLDRAFGVLFLVLMMMFGLTLSTIVVCMFDAAWNPQPLRRDASGMTLEEALGKKARRTKSETSISIWEFVTWFGGVMLTVIFIVAVFGPSALEASYGTPPVRLSTAYLRVTGFYASLGLNSLWQTVAGIISGVVWLLCGVVGAVQFVDVFRKYTRKRSG
jgi:hypothetical protein